MTFHACETFCCIDWSRYDEFGAFILIAYGIVMGMIFSPAMAAQMDSAKLLAEFLPQFVATIAGVLAGAFLAIWAEQRKSLKAEYERCAAAVNLALFTLSRMYALYQKIHKEDVEPARNLPARWFSMPPLDIGFDGQPHFDFGSLQFLLSSKNPDVLSKLDTWRQRFQTLTQTVKRRSEMHVEVLQPRFEAAGLVDAAEITQIEAVAGVRIVQTLTNFTDVIVEFVDDGVSGIPDVFQELRLAALPMIGDRKLVALDVKPATRPDRK